MSDRAILRLTQEVDACLIDLEAQDALTESFLSDIDTLRAALEKSQAQVMELTTKLKEAQTILDNHMIALGKGFQTGEAAEIIKAAQDEVQKQEAKSDDELLMERNVALGYVDGVIKKQDADVEPPFVSGDEQ